MDIIDYSINQSFYVPQGTPPNPFPEPEQECSFCYQKACGTESTYGGRKICPDCKMRMDGRNDTFSRR